jgi:hypothetical protein
MKEEISTYLKVFGIWLERIRKTTDINHFRAEQSTSEYGIGFQGILHPQRVYMPISPLTAVFHKTL